jgi:CheY-like chemotaxis protein
MRQAILNVLTYALDVAQGGVVYVQPMLGDPDEGILIKAQHGQDATAAEPDGDNPVRLGVGLEVCRRLLTIIGGRLEIAARTGGDWEARLLWPRSRQGTLLVIDDNVNFINLFRRYLAGHAWNVVGATSSAEARQILAELRPAVILLDVMMPKEDGWELLCTLKTNRETQQIPVVICSVLNEPALASSLGASAYLPKPVSQESLLRALAPWSPTPASPAREH